VVLQRLLCERLAAPAAPLAAAVAAAAVAAMAAAVAAVVSAFAWQARAGSQLSVTLKKAGKPAWLEAAAVAAAALPY
jgi:hypothetical protein